MHAPGAPLPAHGLRQRTRRRLRCCTAQSLPSTPDRLFTFGFGFTTLALTNLAKQHGWLVAGACRGKEKAASLRSAGVDAFAWSPDDGEGLSQAGLAALQRATHVVTCVPPVGDFYRDPVLVTHQEQLLAATCAGTLRWVGYLSSTGVYGDHSGAWVDETAALRVAPAAGKPWHRAQAEAEWLRLHSQHKMPVHVFRLGGIYGPGRSMLDVRGRPPSATQGARGEKRFISRCHVADIVTALEASMAAPHPGRIYNVVDDDPAPRSVVAAFGEALLRGGAEPSSAPAGDAAVPAGTDEKRVSNARLKAELGVSLRFPSYREGLRAIHNGDRTPFG